ncbi:MAG: hydrogenase 4 subunit D [Eggerthellaceae bacterium]|nr:hydrogenase 4 subunit D [Eggerthellaceae bacterium]
MDLLFVLIMITILTPYALAVVSVFLPRKIVKVTALVAGSVNTGFAILLWVLFANSGVDTIEYSIVAVGSCEILGFVLDYMSVMLTFVFACVGLIIAIYSIGYMSPLNREQPDGPSRRFFCVFMFFMGAMSGVCLSSTITGQLFFFECSTMCSWGLVVYYGSYGDIKSNKAAMKALVVTQIASLGLYLACGVLYSQTGTFAVTAAAEMSVPMKILFLCFVIFAAWGKSAQLPMYFWLPPAAVYEPAPGSAYLHGASMVKVGVAVLARELISIGDIPEVIGWILVIGAICTMVFAFFCYLPQTDMKKLLAFSTISQMSYIYLAFGFFVFGSTLAFQGGLMHIFVHAFAKSLFFLVAGSFSITIGTKMIPQIIGVMKKQPIIGAGLACAALSIAGVPPFGLFFSKFAIYGGAFEVATSNPWLMIIVIIGLAEEVGTFAWMLRLMRKTTPGPEGALMATAEKVPRSVTIAVVLLIIAVLVAGEISGWWITWMA